MPLIIVRIMEGRTPEQVERLISEVTDATQRALDAPRESIRVLVDEYPKTHWGIGGTSAKTLGR